jgi:hypothetical protein
MRKAFEFGLCLCLLAIPALGQNANKPKSNTTIQCRSLDGSATPIQPDEKLVGDQICKAVLIQKAPTASVETDMTPAQSMPKQDSVTAPSTSTSGTEVTPNSVFISPMNGFESYLAAAFAKKQVPLTIVADQARAAYVITGTSDEKKAGVAKMLVFGQIHSDNAASIQMVEQKTAAVVFAYAVNKKNTLHGQQTTAEACAKHLKEQLEKK